MIEPIFTAPRAAGIKASTRAILTACALAAAILIAAVTFFHHIDAPLGNHPSEINKALIMQGQNHHIGHPLLMIQCARLIARVTGAHDLAELVEAGRWASAMAGTLGVALLFLLLADRTTPTAAALATAGAVVTPLLAVHAHYFKEDIWLFFAVTATMFCLNRFLKAPSPGRGAMVGVCIGLAISAKTVGIATLPFLFLCRHGKGCGHVLVPLGLAVAVVLAINLPDFLGEPQAVSEFLRSVGTGIQTAHWDHVKTPFAFHMRYSLRPGIGMALLIVSGLGMVIAIAASRSTPRQPMDILNFAVLAVFLAMIEYSPHKGWPDQSRHAVSLIIPIAYFSAIAIQRVLAHPRALVRAAGMAVIAFAIARPALVTWDILDGFGDETRLVADRLLAGHRGPVLREAYTSFGGQEVNSLGMVDLNTLPPGVTILVASSGIYQRFMVEHDAGLGEHNNAVYAQYMTLFTFPACEIRPRHRYFAYQNPLIRLVALRRTDEGWGGGSLADLPVGEDCEPIPQTNGSPHNAPSAEH